MGGNRPVSAANGLTKNGLTRPHGSHMFGMNICKMFHPHATKSCQNSTLKQAVLRICPSISSDPVDHGFTCSGNITPEFF